MQDDHPSAISHSPHLHRPADVAVQVSAICPFCKSSNTEMISLFGMQLMTSQYYCNNCHSAFEAVKWDVAAENAESAEKNS